MKGYTVEKDLKTYVRHILIRCFYTCCIDVNENGSTWCETNASPDTFRRIIQRAKCEKKEKETGLFYLTEEEAQDTAYRTYLMDRAGVTSFSVIDDPGGEKSIIR